LGRVCACVACARVRARACAYLCLAVLDLRWRGAAAARAAAARALTAVLRIALRVNRRLTSPDHFQNTRRAEGRRRGTRTAFETLCAFIGGGGGGGGGGAVFTSVRYAALLALSGLTMEERGGVRSVRDDAVAFLKQHAPGLASAIAATLPLVQRSHAARRGRAAAALAADGVPAELPLMVDVMMALRGDGDMVSIVAAAGAVLVEDEGGGGARGGARPDAGPFGRWAARLVAEMCVSDARLAGGSEQAPLVAGAFQPLAPQVLAAAEAVGAAAGFEPRLIAALRAGRRALPAAAAAAPAALRACDECGAQQQRLSRCGACQDAHYCSAECQRAAWPAHRAQCAGRAARGGGGGSGGGATARGGGGGA
jgi:hypothetical protein